MESSEHTGAIFDQESLPQTKNQLLFINSKAPIFTCIT